MQVTVTNENETGDIEFNHIRPEVGTGITASLSDPDRVLRITEWQWLNDGVEINGATSATYRPTDNDVNDQLTVQSYLQRRTWRREDSNQLRCRSSSSSLRDVQRRRTLLTPIQTRLNSSTAKAMQLRQLTSRSRSIQLITGVQSTFFSGNSFGYRNHDHHGHHLFVKWTVREVLRSHECLSGRYLTCRSVQI